MKAKRFRAQLLALAFLISSLVPAQKASAVVPIVGLAIAAVAPAGTVAVADILTAGVTALIGGTIAALALTPSTADAPVRVPLMSDKATIDKAMAPPSAPATASSTSTPTYSYKCNSVTAATPQAACDTQAASMGGNGYSAVCTSASESSCSINWVPPSGAPYSAGTWTVQKVSSGSTTSCPNGYTLNGSSCVLSDARLAQADSKSDLTRSASGFTSNDADPLPSYAALNSNKVVAYGQNSKGEPLIFTASTSTDGTQTNIQVQTQTTAGGQSAIETRNIAVNAASGQIISASSSLNAGSLSGVGTGATANTGNAVNSSDIAFPSDYARAGEAAQAANTIKTSVDQLKDRLTDSAAVADPEAPQYTNHWGDTFTGLLSWSLPAHTSTCPVATFDAFERTFRMDSHCQLAADYWDTLRVAMVVVWVILALFILLRA